MDAPAKSNSVLMIGSKAWRDASVRNIKVSQTMVKKADKRSCYDRQADPLPTVRDNTTQYVNDRILCYSRQTRGVVVKLREIMLETNEEMKLLLRSKEDLEQILEHLRKDKLLNKHSKQIRTIRPKREKVGLSQHAACTC